MVNDSYPPSSSLPLSPTPSPTPKSTDPASCFCRGPRDEFPQEAGHLSRTRTSKELAVQWTLIYPNLEYMGARIIRLCFPCTLFTAHHSFLQHVVVILLCMLVSDGCVKQSNEIECVVLSLEDKLISRAWPPSSWIQHPTQSLLKSMGLGELLLATSRKRTQIRSFVSTMDSTVHVHVFYGTSLIHAVISVIWPSIHPSMAGQVRVHCTLVYCTVGLDRPAVYQTTLAYTYIYTSSCPSCCCGDLFCARRKLYLVIHITNACTLNCMPGGSLHWV